MASGPGASSIAQVKCEKTLESIADELAYVTTSVATHARDKIPSGPDSALRILQKGISALLDVSSLKWSSILEQLINNVKLCFFTFDLQEPLAKLADSSLRQSLHVGERPRARPVTNFGLELLIELAKVVKGKDAFCLYRAILINDYPPTFHFLDLLHPDAFVYLHGTGIVDQFVLVKLIKSLVLGSKNTLVHAESTPVGSRWYVSSSHAMASTLEELVLCLVKFYQNRRPHPQSFRIDNVHQLLITTMQVITVPKLGARFFERLSCIVMDLVRTSSLTSVDRDLVLDIVLEIIKEESSLVHAFVKNLLATNLVEASLNSVTTFMNDLVHMRPPQEALGPLAEFELLTKLADTYLAEFNPVCIRSMNIALDLVRTYHALEARLLQYYATRQVKASASKGGQWGIEPLIYASKIYIYDTDKIGKVVRYYNPPKKLVDDIVVRTFSQHPYFFVFRQCLHFLEAVVRSVGRGVWPETDANKILISSIIGYFEQFVQMSEHLIDFGTHFISQGTFDCLAAISSQLFSQISEDAQQQCLANILRYARSDSVMIRIKAGRCLAIYLEFDDVAQADDTFLLHAFEIIERNFDLTDSECDSTYSWGFGNFTGVLATHYQGVLIGTGTPEDFLARLRALAQRSLQNVKTLHNGFRALGNIFHWAPSSYLSVPLFVQFLKESVEALTRQVGVGRDFKARWNACCALGNLFKNANLAEFAQKQFFPQILASLSACILKSESCKEQAHCLTALQKLESRMYYGDSMRELWECLIRVVEEPSTSKPSEKGDNAELRSEELQYRVGQCLAHFVSLMEKEDFSPLNEFLLEHSDILNQLFEKLRGDIRIPDQLLLVDKAFYHLRELRKTDKAFARLECVELLCDLLDTRNPVNI